ncbi:MAG: ABC transporter substrate-binding protein [Spirochaetota bacterium]
MFFVIMVPTAYTIELQATIKPMQHHTRVISLSPSITAMIQDLGCEHVLAGVTQYHPPLSRKIPIVGNITNPNIEAIVALQPDIILFSKEDAVTQKLTMLQHAGFTNYCLSSADSFESICNNYIRIAEILNKKDYALQKLSQYKSKRNNLLRKKTYNAIILLSANPFIAVSRRSYISNIFADAGIHNTLYYSKTRYPLMQREYLIASNVDMIIVLSNDALPNKITCNKKIIRIPYEGLYLYTPHHYCDSLQHVVSVLYGQ